MCVVIYCCCFLVAGIVICCAGGRLWSRVSKRLADQEEARAHHENSEHDADSEADDPDTPGSSPSAHSESSGNEDEGNIQDESSGNEDEGNIQEIIGHEDIRGVRYYWIHWEGYPREEATKIRGSWITGTIGRVRSLLLQYALSRFRG